MFSAIFAQFQIVVFVTRTSRTRSGEDEGELFLPGLFVIVHPLYL